MRRMSAQTLSASDTGSVDTLTRGASKPQAFPKI